MQGANDDAAAKVTVLHIATSSAKALEGNRIESSLITLFSTLLTQGERKRVLSCDRLNKGPASCCLGADCCCLISPFACHFRIKTCGKCSPMLTP